MVKRIISVDHTFFDLCNCENGVAAMRKGLEWNKLAARQQLEFARLPSRFANRPGLVTADGSRKTPAPSVPRAPASTLRGGACARMRGSGTLWLYSKAVTSSVVVCSLKGVRAVRCFWPLSLPR